MNPSAPKLKALVTTLFAPKDGNTTAQYEDAFATHFSPETDPQILTIAVADGASSAIFAREWAELLVNDFVENPFLDEAETRERVAKLADIWQDTVSRRDLPWYAAEKLPYGSAAALLVAQFDLVHRSLRVRAVGDVCLFGVRDGGLQIAFPHNASVQFDDRPALISSNQKHPLPDFQELQGEFAPGDRFYLMTDALAACVLDVWEAGKSVWETLPESEPSFQEWLDAQRGTNGLKNDDITLIRLDFTA